MEAKFHPVVKIKEKHQEDISGNMLDYINMKLYNTYTANSTSAFMDLDTPVQQDLQMKQIFMWLNSNCGIKV